MFLTIYTIIHVIISLVGILSGFVVLAGLLTATRFDCATSLFLATTVTGFFFPFHGFTPAIGLGIISLVVLAVSAFARYPRQMAGGWRKTYVITAVLALYFNVFVFVVQSFEKIPALKSLAPTQTEPPFRIVQLIVLILFIVLGTLAAIRFRAEPVPAVQK